MKIVIDAKSMIKIRREPMTLKGFMGRSSIEGTYRVVRGGSWNNDARNCRTANRNNNDPRNRNDNQGFRLVFVP